jgi:hypothetical protein
VLHFHKVIRFAAAGIVMAAIGCAAQAVKTDPAVKADPQIAAALKQISAKRIQANIEKLVSFGTRLTISAQDPASISAGRGIGAAREWIKSEFDRYSKDCGGCLEVKTDSFTEEPADRIPKATEITNVYAVLKGMDPASAKRIVLVTGHYDSRNSDTLDVNGDAPGANDDGSGTAVSLECARVLSKMKFSGTIVFLAVAGEEQGLNGSKHFAKMAKDQGWELEAVLNNDIVGGDKSAEQNHSVVRVFSEGVPAAATEQEIRRIRGLGGENGFGLAPGGSVYGGDGPSVRHGSEADAGVPAGSLFAGRRSLFVQPAGICCCAADGVSRRLSSPAPECAN